jgi:hypothetical protein
MAEKPNGTGVLEVTLGMRVNLNVYGPDGKPVAYNKCELWAEVKAADSATARAELDEQVMRMMGEYALTFGPGAAESPLVEKKTLQPARSGWSEDQKKFAHSFCISVDGTIPVDIDRSGFESWKIDAIKRYGQEKYDAFRKEYVASQPKKQ